MNLPDRPDPSPLGPSGQSPRSLGWPIGGGLLALLALTLVVGLQLGAMPWRFRRQMWQLQGAVAGGTVGVVVGLAFGRRHRRKE